jgi:phosphoglycolate phosphatase
MAIKLVIFDFDGTLADTFSLMLRYGQKYANKEGIEADLSNQEFVEELRNSHMKDLIDRFGVSLVKIPRVVADVREALKREIKDVKMFEGLDRVLYELKSMGFSLGVLTSNTKEIVENFNESHNLDGVFDFVHSEKNLFGKHHAIRKVIRKRGLKHSEVLYVGDEARDVEACKKAHIRCLAVEWGFNSKYALDEHEADYIVDSPDELLMKIKYLSEAPETAN